MAESFLAQKRAAKIDNVKRINRDDARLLKIKNLSTTATGSIDEDVLKKLLESVAAHPTSQLNVKYVKEKLLEPGQHVIVYERNDAILPGSSEEEFPSAFIIYELFVEKERKLVAPVDILSSFDSKNRLLNLLKEENIPDGQVDVAGAGTIALRDLEHFMKEFGTELGLEICEIRYVIPQCRSSVLVDRYTSSKTQPHLCYLYFQ